MEPRRKSDAPGHAAVLPAQSNTSNLLNTVLVVLLIITSVVVSAYTALRLATSAGSGSSVKKSQYQALFLTNGQVYFGHLSSVDGSYVKLKDIYYLQVQQTVQPGQAADANNNNQNVSLAKLGGELHGPEDQMFVQHDQVLFWENLKNDGKVAQAIKDYQAKK